MIEKPFTPQIIKLMAEHSPLSAAIASAMKWEFWRRQKVEDIKEKSLGADCAFCTRYDHTDEFGGTAECPLYKLFGGCCHHITGTFYLKALKARNNKDQQTFTQSANDLYFLIMKIIEDLYKPAEKCGNCNHWDMERNGECLLEVYHNRCHRYDDKACKGWAFVPGADNKPEPKKEEKFYHTGQHFKLESAEYMLAEIGMNKVVMVNIKGTSLWGTRKKINNPEKITEEEFAKIVCSRAFTLIEDKKC